MAGVPVPTNRYKIWFRHYGQTRMYTTAPIDRPAVLAFLDPATYTGEGKRYRTIHEAAEYLYKKGVAACGYSNNAYKDRAPHSKTKDTNK